jgi:hypothetical protein
MTGNRTTRLATTGVVLTVAAFAAVVSYSHIYDLATAHGQSGTAARLLPLSVDGLILAGSLIVLHEARRGVKGPALAWASVWLGVGMTVSANVLYGVRFGLLGALLSGWPAIAFIVATHALMDLLKRAGKRRAVVQTDARKPATAPVAASAPPASVRAPKLVRPVRADAADALLRTATETFKGEPVPALRVIQRRMQIGQRRAQQVQAHLNQL